ncbi:MAG: hypothetical protein KDA21_11695 [Phycisphaerales bacterium]|nr:hypothetical protein [Phycisphaerales bacterium]
MNRWTCSVGVVMLAAAASCAGDSRYWVGGIIDTWNDPANWSTSPSGPGPATIPGEDDSAWVRNSSASSNKIVIFDEVPGAGTMDWLVIQGTGSGGTGELFFLLNRDTLRTHILDLGVHGSLAHSDGTLDVGMFTGQSAQSSETPGMYTLSSDGLLIADQVSLHAGGSSFQFEQEGGTAQIGTLEVGDNTSTSRVTALLSGGLMQANRVEIGSRSPGTLMMEGGTLEAGAMSMGFAAHDGRLTQLGGVLTADELEVGWLSDGSDGHIATFAGGSANITTIEIVGGVSPRPDAVIVSGGNLTTDDIFMSRDTCYVAVTDGVLTINDSLGYAGFTDDTSLFITGGTTTVDAIRLGNIIELSGGSLHAGSIFAADAVLDVSPGAELEIDNYATVEELRMDGGHIHGGFIPPLNLYLLGDLRVGDVLSYSGGEVTCQVQLTSTTLSLAADLDIQGLLEVRGVTHNDPSHRLRAPRWTVSGIFHLHGGIVESYSLDFVLSSSNAQLLGPGRVEGDVVSLGTLEASGDGNISPLIIDGELTCEPGSRVKFDILRTGTFTLAPRIDVTGAATVGGVLNVDVSGPLSPAPGARYTVMNAASVQGRFDVVNFNQSGSVPYDFKTVYEPGRVLIEVIPPVCWGDANGDSVVNFTDLETLLEGWGQEVTPGENGDVTCNGIVDFADLNIVLNNWGVTCH